jgi:hypothetical protein
MPKAKKANSASDSDLEKKYEVARFGLTQERNDFLLPQIIDFVQTKKWVNLHPEYQRRLVWDQEKKSLLMESLLMNVPIPPVFLYEFDLSQYEVMDGQQRLNTIVEFYDNRFELKGLEEWHELNGKKYADLPPRLRQGLDRRRVSATVLLAETSAGVEGRRDLRRIVFERLNTGGLNLVPQELRNCLFDGPFNKLLIELAGDRTFDTIWEIPPYGDNIRPGHVSPQLREHPLYRRMTDCEIVLRFFAFREKSHIKGSVKRMLDGCMERNISISEAEKAALRELFLSRLRLANAIFGAATFRMPDEAGIETRLSIPLYDSLMVALDRLYDHHDIFKRKAARIRKRFEQVTSEPVGREALVARRSNNARAIKERQKAVEDLLREFI